MQASFDLVIEGGTLIDGTRAPRFEADLGLRDGRVAAIGQLAGQPARQRIPAHGLVVAPGFIDAHTHDDLAVLARPGMDFKVSQGVTTVITGNCGLSPAPLRADTPTPAPLSLAVGSGPGQRFARFADYLQAMRDRPAAVNVAALVGHTTLRALTMGDLGRAATAAERAAMQEHVREALQAGAVGVSTGTYYPPAAAASTEEIIDACRPLTGSGAVFATHMRDEGDHVMRSLDETFRIGRELQVPVVVSHHKVTGDHNWGRSGETLDRIRRAMQKQAVCLDCYPYTAGSTMLHNDPERLRGRVLIAHSAPHPDMAGRELADIAREWGVDLPQAVSRLQPASAIYFMMDEADVQRILGFESTMVGSDGIPLGERPHPRLWGTFARVLGRYSRELNLFPLETAVWKMTGLTAANFGLGLRGTLVPGAPADVVLFDADTVIDRATYEDPKQPAAGIQLVLVNGQAVWREGAVTGARPWQVLRPERSRPAATP